MSLILHGVAHGFAPGPPLFSALSLELHPGRSYALVGPSGSGKSTLLGLLAADTHPVEGTIQRPAAWRTTWVFQNPQGTAGRSALDHVSLPLLAAGRCRADADATAIELLDEFALSAVAHTAYRHLSGGEAQRLMLARALASVPQLLLVDEPTAQLDRSTAQTVNAVLGRVTRRGAVVVIATHDPDTRDACTDVIDLAGYR